MEIPAPPSIPRRILPLTVILHTLESRMSPQLTGFPAKPNVESANEVTAGTDYRFLISSDC